MENFKEKYLEYKTKYLLLKQQVGGNWFDDAIQISPEVHLRLKVIEGQINYFILKHLNELVQGYPNYQLLLNNFQKIQFIYKIDIRRNNRNGLLYVNKNLDYYERTLISLRNSAFRDIIFDINFKIEQDISNKMITKFAFVDYENQIRGQSNAQLISSIMSLVPNHRIFLFSQDHSPERIQIPANLQDQIIHISPPNSSRTELDDIALVITLRMVMFYLNFSSIQYSICNRNLSVNSTNIGFPASIPCNTWYGNGIYGVLKQGEPSIEHNLVLFTGDKFGWFS
tara:strand:- start:238 stop:1086 length:849 start_codon:yes stop_codon:yes gene_type:complete